MATLYRTYRPKTFAEVAGQEHITRTLAEQIASKKLSHAYLFAGSRGLGKTSIARIFAKELGCGERDIYEIDAASNNSVDDIRSLTDNVYTLPFESPYKVYILDEAHMLSKGAWNAFLKTLEEPPAYVIFILATTELSKVPETVQSRCQVYEFKKPNRSSLARLVSEIASKENFTLEPGVAELVALLGDGSYRDVLSILEKVLGSSSENGKEVAGKSVKQKVVTLEDAERLTGAPRHSLVLELITALSESSTADAALTAINKASQASVDMSLYLSMVLDLARTVLLVRHAAELRKEIAEEVGADAYAEIEKLAVGTIAQKNEKDSHPTHLNHKALLAFLNASEQIRFSPIPSLPIELAVIGLYE